MTLQALPRAFRDDDRVALPWSGLDKTTLNEQFRRWLAEYAHSHARVRMQRYDAVMQGLRGQMKVGRTLTREEMNER